ncbi:MAG: SDR family NAD(P)-dependent oxidoreductase [Acidimicrobiales bacterium]
MHGFDQDTTTDEVLEGVDLTDRRFVVTGASGGLGEETTRALAARGASVAMLARDSAKNTAAADRIRAEVGDAQLSQYTVDLASLDSIRQFSDEFNEDHDAVDVLINNAGVMACPYGLTADGFELQFGTNHLGHFLLTACLWPAIAAGDSPRVVTLSSSAHGEADVDLADPGFEATEYNPWVAYGRSKSANALFARELARRAGDQGVLSYSVHPGAIMTDLGRHLTDELLAEAMERFKARAEAAGESGDGGFEFKTVPAGAATETLAAAHPDVQAPNGSYLADCRVGELGENVAKYGIKPHILDDDTAAALWVLSEEMVNQTFAP